jgi:hypothetical protein
MTIIGICVAELHIAGCIKKQLRNVIKWGETILNMIKRKFKGKLLDI